MWTVSDMGNGSWRVHFGGVVFSNYLNEDSARRVCNNLISIDQYGEAEAEAEARAEDARKASARLEAEIKLEDEHLEREVHSDSQ